MNILFINACIREESRTLRLSRAYLKSHIGDNDTIKELFLPDMALTPLNKESLAKREADCLQGEFTAPEYQLAKDFAEAGSIVIAAPYGDCLFPAILKIYLENICINGITFAYGTGGKPQKLCKAENITFITSSGGYIPEHNSLRLYMEELTAMFGIENLSFYSAQGLDINSNNTDEILNSTILSMQ